MNKFALVFKHELRTLVLRKSFLMVLVLVPLVPFVIMSVASFLGVEQSSAIVEEFFIPEEEVMIDGFIDHSGLVTQVPDELSERLLAYETEAEAEQAAENGEIQSWLVIEADYLETGMVKQYNAPDNLLGGFDGKNKVDVLMAFNLLEGDLAAYERLRAPMVVEAEILADAPQRSPDAIMTFLLPYIITMLFYGLIFGNASQLLRSVTKEKENRMLEGLLTSMRPIDLIVGKITAGGLAGLLQTSFWLICSYGLMRMSGRQFGLSEAFMLPVPTLMWGLVFFLLGYAIYASLMAGVGAVVPNIKEASQYSMLVSAPIIASMMTFSAVIGKPDSGFSVVMSLIPFTSPIIMMTRLAAGPVPLWQLLLAVGLMIATVAWIIFSVTRLFHAQIMLAGSPLKLKRFLKAFIGKA
jgi:ABC-2 type transport system permease protein